MTKQYIVRKQLGKGAAYLTTRVTRNSNGKYRWTKACKESATILSEGQARSAARRYGGTLVRVV